MYRAHLLGYEFDPSGEKPSSLDCNRRALSLDVSPVPSETAETAESGPDDLDGVDWTTILDEWAAEPDPRVGSCRSSGAGLCALCSRFVDCDLPRVR